MARAFLELDAQQASLHASLARIESSFISRLAAVHREPAER
jgi:hypothetical protein